jgi:hypothetical protein
MAAGVSPGVKVIADKHGIEAAYAIGQIAGTKPFIEKSSDEA